MNRLCPWCVEPLIAREPVLLLGLDLWVHIGCAHTASLTSRVPEGLASTPDVCPWCLSPETRTVDSSVFCAGCGAGLAGGAIVAIVADRLRRPAAEAVPRLPASMRHLAVPDVVTAALIVVFDDGSFRLGWDPTGAVPTSPRQFGGTMVQTALVAAPVHMPGFTVHATPGAARAIDAANVAGVDIRHLRDVVRIVAHAEGAARGAKYSIAGVISGNTRVPYTSAPALASTIPAGAPLFPPPTDQDPEHAARVVLQAAFVALGRLDVKVTNVVESNPGAVVTFSVGMEPKTARLQSGAAAVPEAARPIAVSLLGLPANFENRPCARCNCAYWSPGSVPTAKVCTNCGDVTVLRSAAPTGPPPPTREITPKATPPPPPAPDDSKAKVALGLALRTVTVFQVLRSPTGIPGQTQIIVRSAANANFVCTLPDEYADELFAGTASTPRMNFIARALMDGQAKKTSPPVSPPPTTIGNPAATAVSASLSPQPATIKATIGSGPQSAPPDTSEEGNTHAKEPSTSKDDNHKGTGQSSATVAPADEPTLPAGGGKHPARMYMRPGLDVASQDVVTARCPAVWGWGFVPWAGATKTRMDKNGFAKRYMPEAFRVYYRPGAGWDSDGVRAATEPLFTAQPWWTDEMVFQVCDVEPPQSSRSGFGMNLPADMVHLPAFAGRSAADHTIDSPIAVSAHLWLGLQFLGMSLSADIGDAQTFVNRWKLPIPPDKLDRFIRGVWGAPADNSGNPIRRAGAALANLRGSPDLNARYGIVVSRDVDEEGQVWFTVRHPGLGDASGTLLRWPRRWLESAPSYWNRMPPAHRLTIEPPVSSKATIGSDNRPTFDASTFRARRLAAARGMPEPAAHAAAGILDGLVDLSGDNRKLQEWLRTAGLEAIDVLSARVDTINQTFTMTWNGTGGPAMTQVELDRLTRAGSLEAAVLVVADAVRADLA